MNYSIHTVARCNPDGMRDAAGSGGPQSVWIYKNHRTSRPEATGWSNVVVPGVQDQNREVVQAAVPKEFYRTPVKMDLHVISIGGVVSSCESVRN